MDKMESMLLSLTVENFRPFAKETTLDMQKPTFHTVRPRGDEKWVDVVEKRAAIFGPNASGKSTILKPLGLLQKAICESLLSNTPGKALFSPHKLHTTSSTTYITEYVRNDVRYRWELKVDKEGVVFESVFANAVRTWRPIFERSRNDIVFHPASGIKKATAENISQFLTPWSLTLSAWGRVKSKGSFFGAAEWWLDSLLPIIDQSRFDQEGRHGWITNMAAEHVEWLELIAHVAAAADVGINDVSVKEEQLPNDLEFFFSSEETRGSEIVVAKSHPDGEDFESYLRFLEFHHGNDGASFALSEHDESLGTRAWIDHILPAVYALAYGRLLVIDELDGSLHPILVRAFIGLFADEHLNTEGAQLIFTTHDSTLLGNHPDSALSASEVWFTEKKDTYSDFFALSEFPVRAQHNIEKRYFQGVFGALPVAQTSKIAEALSALRKKLKSPVNEYAHG
ncbi:hypothetical protein CFELI_12055 [Corynebacterium felinum]|nr:hypothetical protein CFELI_12055 [Corynebacterium felinum]